MDHVDETRLKIQNYLTQLGNPMLDGDGDLSLRHGSTRVFVRVTDFGDGDTYVEVFAPILFQVPLTPELFEYVALNNQFKFGGFELTRSDDSGVGTLMFSHGLLGTYLDPAELIMAVGLIARQADGLDDELQARFGGNLMHSD